MDGEDADVSVGGGGQVVVGDELAQPLSILLGSVLPLEEFVFFLLTNTLLTFGLVLVWAEESQARIIQLRRRWRRLCAGKDERIRVG